MERKYYAWLEVKRLNINDYLGRGPTCFKDVEIELFRNVDDFENERKQYNFSPLIKDVEDTARAEEYVLELFTKEEIDEMKTYFKSEAFQHTQFHYNEEKFPIKSNYVSADEWSGVIDGIKYAYWKDDDYPLKVKVRGYFNPKRFQKINAEIQELLDLLNNYHQLYAFDDQQTKHITSNEENPALVKSVGKMLDGFPVLLFIKTGTSKDSALSLLSKFKNLLQGSVLQDLDSGMRETEHSPVVDNILVNYAKALKSY